MVLRMMAEELRHGYQMLHLLTDDDWQPITGQTKEQTVEEILSMKTGSHVLGAFNIDFESFVDNIVFCALIDRVGKYQLAMQKVSAYAPMAESMPQMLREEAFHLATGVVPLRRWVVKAAQGSPMITMEVIQKHLNKWVPRGLEMFGDERGGGTNVKCGLKPMKNAEAQEQYAKEIGKVVRDLNMRYLRARLPELTLGRGRSRRSRSSSATAAASDGVALRGPAAAAAPRLLPPPRRAGLHAWSASTARRFARRRGTTSRISSGRCPTATARRATSRTTSTTCARSPRGEKTRRGGAEVHAAAAPRRRRLPVLEVGALGGRRAIALPERRSDRTPDLRAVSRRATMGLVELADRQGTAARSRRPIVGRVASRYVAGETLDDALATVETLAAEGAMATLDLLGEEVREAPDAPPPRSTSTSACSTPSRRAGCRPTSRSSCPSLGLKIDEAFCREQRRAASSPPRRSTATSCASTWRTPRPPTRRCASTATSTPAIGNLGVVLQAYMRRTLADIAALPRDGANVRLCKGIYIEPRADRLEGLRDRARELSPGAREAVRSRRLRRHRDPRRAPRLRRHRRSSTGCGMPPRALRVPDAARRRARAAADPARRRPPAARLRAVRPRLVPLLDAPPARESRGRDATS